MCRSTYTIEMLKRAALVALLLLLAVFEIYVCATFLPFHRRETNTAPSTGDGLLAPALLMSFVLVTIGVVSFVSPEALQDYALRQNAKWFPTNPFLDWMKTTDYVRFLRFIGLAVYIASLFAAYVLLKRFWQTVFI
jgi:hypothetical protein